MLTIADKGGGVRKMFKKRRLWVLRMWIKRTIDSNLTVYVKQSKAKGVGTPVFG